MVLLVATIALLAVACSEDAPDAPAQPEAPAATTEAASVPGPEAPAEPETTTTTAEETAPTAASPTTGAEPAITTTAATELGTAEDAPPGEADPSGEASAAEPSAVEYRAIEFGDLVAQLTTSYDWEAMVIGFTGGPEPHNGINLWHSSGGLHLWHPNQESPARDWEAQIDELFVSASQELDPAERVKQYHRVQEIVAENAPLIYVTVPERLTAVRNVFGNTTPTLYGVWDIRHLYRADL